MANPAEYYSNKLRGGRFAPIVQAAPYTRPSVKFRFRRKRTAMKRTSGIVRSLSTHRYIRRSAPILLTLNNAYGISGVNGSATNGFGVAFGFCMDKIIVKVGASAAVNGATLWTDLTTLYDMYRIDRICLDMYWTDNNSSNANTVPLPLFQIATDYDDLVPPASNYELVPYSNMRILQFGLPQHKKHVLYPKISESVNTVSSLGTAGVTLRKAGYINSETPDVVHTGVKMFFDSASTSNVVDGYIQLYVTYHLTMKLVK